MFWKKPNCNIFICLATADIISISVSPTKGSRFIAKKKYIKATQTKNETTQNYPKVLM